MALEAALGQAANLCLNGWVLTRMTTKFLSTLAVLAVLVIMPAAASAAEPARPPFPAPVADSQGIIAILIGLAVQPYTPPIGSNKGS